MRWDIVALGEPLYELNQQPDGRFVPGFGGDTSNVAVAAARLGARTAYISRLGTDVFGTALRALWHAEGVDDTAVHSDPDAPTGRYFVTHGPEGHSFTYKREGSAASRLSPADLPQSMIADAAFLHVSGISQAISQTAEQTVDAAIAMARSAGVKVSYDTNFRPRLWDLERAKPAILRAASQAQIVKTSVDEGRALTGLETPDAIARHFLALGPEIVLVTMGASGALLAQRGSITHVPAPMVQAVDATGAGDCFTAAFLTEQARGKTPAEAASFASAAAALSTTGYGAITPLPVRSAVAAFLHQG